MDKNGFDIASLNLEQDANSEAPIEILHPVTKAKLGITIYVMGAESTAYRNIIRRQQNRRLKLLSKNRRIELTLEETEEEALDLLVAVTKRWDGLVWDGKAIECSEENIRMVYQERPWLRQQVDEGVNDPANFTRS